MTAAQTPQAEWGDQAREMLKDAARGWAYVDEENFLAVADLLRAGLVTIQQNFDTMDVRTTDAGSMLAIALGLLTPEQVRG